VTKNGINVNTFLHIFYEIFSEKVVMFRLFEIKALYLFCSATAEKKKKDAQKIKKR